MTIPAKKAKRDIQCHGSSSIVGFSSVEIIELPYTLGDNPAVSCGPPISASWGSQKRTILNLDFFEQYRPFRRDKEALHLSRRARTELYVMLKVFVGVNFYH